MSQENANIHYALCSVLATASGGGVTPTYSFTKGFTSPNAVGTPSGAGSHTATGVYNLALDQPLDTINSTVQVSCKTATADASASYTRPDVNTIQVTTYAAGAAADTVGFDVVVHVPPAG